MARPPRDRYTFPPLPAALTEYLHGVMGIVEANRFEQNSLWAACTQTTDKVIPWLGSLSGFGVTVGTLAKQPVHIALQTAQIGVARHKILFIYPTSNVVDHDMIRRWLMSHCPDAQREGRLNFHDADNFPNVFPPRSASTPVRGLRQSHQPATPPTLQ